MDKNSRIFVAGGLTLIGAAILRQLDRQGYQNLVSEQNSTFDLTDPVQVSDFFSSARPEYVFLAAGKSGGIEANRRYPASLMLDNLQVECNVIHSAYRYGATKLLYLASSCCYPRQCPQPMQVESLLTGPLEPTNEAYAVAKIAGIQLCKAYRQQYGANFIIGIPANNFGPGDNFSPEDSHVIAALIRKMHEAKTLSAPFVEIWGTGIPRREFIYADDLADACLFMMHNYAGIEPINLGCGVDLSIKQLAELTKSIVAYSGEILFNTSKPDGMPVKILDSCLLKQLGWQPRTPFEVGLKLTYDWYLENQVGSLII